MKGAIKLDKIDAKLIELLQLNSRVSTTELSNAVSLSRPSVSERVSRLIDKGILEHFTVSVPPELVGRKISFYIHISNLRVPFKKIEEVLLANENISEIHTVTGSTNYIVKASVENVDKMTEILSELMEYGQIVTSVILNSPLKQRPVKPVIDSD